MFLKNRFLILNVTALAAFGLYELKRKVIVLPPVYVYVRVPAPGVKTSEYESGCLGALTKVAMVNEKLRDQIRDTAK